MAMINPGKARTAVGVAIAGVTLVLTAACSSAAGGRGSTAPTSTAPAATASPAARSGSTPAPTDPSARDSSSSTAASGGSGGQRSIAQPDRLRCTGTPEQLTDCFGASLSAYWLDHSPGNQQADQIVLLQIPSDPADDPCTKAARTAEGPFTCTTDAGELYFPPSFQSKLRSWFSAADLPYAYASVLSHEYGHYLQLDVRDPAVSDQNKTAAQTKVVEQQADCLSGVWAHDAALNHGFDAGRFNAVAMELIRQVSSNSEIYTHGTPDERFTALDRGLGTGRPSSCGLAGLH